MNRSALIARCRSITQDTKNRPYLWSDDEFGDALNEAGDEACIRARLIERDDIELNVSANDPKVEIPDYAWSISRVAMNGRKLDLVDRQMLDEREGVDWESRTAEEPLACYEVNGSLRLYPIPTVAGVLKIHSFCTPESQMSEDDDEPAGIRPRLHEKLIDWALHVAYLKADSDTFNADLADKYEADFEKTFGPRPDEKAMRRLRINVTRRTTGAYF